MYIYIFVTQLFDLRRLLIGEIPTVKSEGEERQLIFAIRHAPLSGKIVGHAFAVLVLGGGA
jgi:hypothetical protein